MSKVNFNAPGAGELDKRITIRLRHDLPVGQFDIDQKKLNPIKRWASLKPVGTSVWQASVQTDEAVTHRCIIRYMGGITTSHEVLYNDLVYRVRRCAPLQGNKVFLVIELEELGEENAIYG